VTLSLDQLLRRLKACDPGLAGWRDFEDAGIGLLTALLVPPLRPPLIQVRNLSGADRRDALFPNAEIGTGGPWGYLREEAGARLPLVEFKNYDREDIGKQEIDQARTYLTEPIGRLALLCCNKTPARTAYHRRNMVYTQEKKIILFLTPSELREMCDMKARGDDPSDLIVDLLHEFYAQYE
jgi:hypothetical protein